MPITIQRPSSSGDVGGPSVANDNAVARFDGTTGKLLKDSPNVTLTDGGVLSGVTQIINPTGNLIIEELGATSEITLKLGTTTSATHFGVHDSADATLFRVGGDGVTSVFGALGVGIATPDVTALVEMASTTLGFLPPRMTTTQRDAIFSPASGLEIYNITTSEPEYFDGSQWVGVAGGSTTPGGSNTQIQFNNAGAFGGISTITTDGTNLTFADNASLGLGAGNDLQLSHTGSLSVLSSAGSPLDILQISDQDLTVRNLGVTSDILMELGTATSATAFKVIDSALANLMRIDGAGDVLFGTAGINIVNSGVDLEFPDNGVLRFGAGNDLILFHDGSLSSILNTNGELLIRQNSTDDIVIHNSAPAHWIIAKLGTDTSLTRFNVRSAADVDLFRVDGAGDVAIGSAWTVDGATGDTSIDGELLVGTGIASGDSEVHIHKGSAGAVAAGGESVLTLENSGNVAMQFLTPNINHQHIIFGRPANTFHGSIFYNLAAVPDGFTFKTGGDVFAMTIDADQNVGIGTTSANNAAALLQLDSTTQGFLMPRVTTTQRDAIATPPTGLEIYNTTTLEPEFFNGSSWVSAGANLYTADGTITGTRLVTLENGDGLGFAAFDVLPGNSTIRSQISLFASGWVLDFGSGGPPFSTQSFLQFANTTGFTLQDGEFLTGLKYVADYSSNFVDRSLIDKAYVDSTNVAGADEQVQFNSSGVIAASADFVFDGTNVGIGTGSPISLLEVSSTGDAQITITADTDNSVETDNPTLLLQQDGGLAQGLIGIGDAGSAARFVGQINNSTFVEAKGAADGLQFATGGAVNAVDGTARMTIRNTGLIGVGTTVPASPFHIFENSATTGVAAGLTIEQDGLGDAVAQFFLTGGQRWVIGLDNSDGDKFKIASSADVGTAERLTIQTTGEVSIGGDAPRSPFEVLFGSAPANGTARQRILRSDANSNIGSTPVAQSYYLGLGGQEFGIGHKQLIGFGFHSMTSGASFWPSYIGSIDRTTASSSFNDLIFATRDVTTDTEPPERMRITGEGRVGIGITNPKSNLHILTSGTTGLGVVPAARGMAISGIDGQALLYMEATDGPVGERVWVMQSVGSELLFSSVSDDAASDTVLNILTLGHSTGNVGMGVKTPDAVARLQLDSTTKGFLKPRLTTTQRDAIATPPAGLSVHDTTVSRPSFFDGTDWLYVDASPANVIQINSQAAWDAQVSGGTITIAANTTFMLNTTISTTDEIVVNTGIAFSILGSRISSAGILYTGGATLITSDGTSFLRIDGINNLDGNSTGTLFNIDNSSVFVEISNCGVFNWASLGTIDDSAQFRILSVGFFESGAGFTSDGVGVVFLSGMVLANSVDMASAYINIVNQDETTNVIVESANVIFLQAGESLLRIDPGIGDASSISASSNTISGPGALFEAAGTTGAITAFADAAVALTTIDSVTDSGGVARFNFTVGPTLFVNQEVDIVNFVTQTTYNQTGIITATGAGFFEVASIAFVADDATGDFSSASVTATSSGHGLSAGQTLAIDTNESTDYDGGATIYDVTGTTFRINRVFTVTHTANWDTGGINQTDVRVLAFANPGFSDSKNIAAAFVNNNATAHPAITNNTFSDMAFGTAGDALVSASNIERWKLVDPVVGIFEFTGNEPFDGILNYDFTSVSSGGAQEFRFKWLKDTGSGFAVLPDDVEVLVEVGTTASSVSKSQPLTANKGDQIKPQVTRNAGTSTLTTSYASVNAVNSAE